MVQHDLLGFHYCVCVRDDSYGMGSQTIVPWFLCHNVCDVQSCKRIRHEWSSGGRSHSIDESQCT